MVRVLSPVEEPDDDGESEPVIPFQDVPVERPNISELRSITDMLSDTQRLRIKTSNRLSALSRGVDHTDPSIVATLEGLQETLEQNEKDILKGARKALKAYPVWRLWLRKVPGIDVALAAPLLALLLPARPDMAVSTWYKAAGINVEEGRNGDMRLPGKRRARRLTDGRLSVERNGPIEGKSGAYTFHPRLRVTLHNIADQFVRGVGFDSIDKNGKHIHREESYYRAVYVRQKTRLMVLHDGDWAPYKIDHTARWATVKLFLSHLWEKTLEAQGYDPAARRAYVIDRLGHHYLPPPEFD